MIGRARGTGLFSTKVAALVAAALVAIPSGVVGQRATTERAIQAAQEGGTILVCRHAITDSFAEREPVDYGDLSTQRKLDEEGEEQSRRIGASLRALGVEVSDLVASPMHRAIRTAELLFGTTPRADGIWHTNGSDYGGEPKEARLRFLERRPADGNALVVSHIGTMSSVLPEADGRVGEGDCVVVRPLGDGHVVIGIVRWRDWIETARLGG
jgi:phosphohistidine phosphatase SixA